MTLRHLAQQRRKNLLKRNVFDANCVVEPQIISYTIYGVRNE